MLWQKKNYVKNSGFISYKNNKGFLSPKTNKYNMNFNNGISKLEEFNKNRPNNYINFIQSSSKKIKHIISQMLQIIIQIKLTK